jgi:hypothetical protein
MQENEQLTDEQFECWRLDRTEASFIDELFRRHHRRVALWCLRLAGERETAADWAQEVFLIAYKNLGSFRGESKFSTWLYTIMWPEDVERLHELWLRLSEKFGAKLHHRDVLGVATTGRMMFWKI